MIHHIVMFRLEDGAESAATLAKRFKGAIEALPAQIEELDSVAVHLDCGAIAGNWTMVLEAVCRDNAALAAYSAHPAHLACVAIIKPQLAGRACVDFEA